MSENTKAAKAVEKIDADYSLEAVPESARKGFWNMFFVMVGFTFFSASMSVGAKLGNGLDLTGFIWACIIGGVILRHFDAVLFVVFLNNLAGLEPRCIRFAVFLLYQFPVIAIDDVHAVASRREWRTVSPGEIHCVAFEFDNVAVREVEFLPTAIAEKHCNRAVGLRCRRNRYSRVSAFNRLQILLCHFFALLKMKGRHPFE